MLPGLCCGWEVSSYLCKIVGISQIFPCERLHSEENTNQIKTILDFKDYLSFWLSGLSFKIFFKIFCTAQWSVNFIRWIKSREIDLKFLVISPIEKHLLKSVAPQYFLWQIGGSTKVHKIQGEGLSTVYLAWNVILLVSLVPSITTRSSNLSLVSSASDIS